MSIAFLNTIITILGVYFVAVGVVQLVTGKPVGEPNAEVKYTPESIRKYSITGGIIQVLLGLCWPVTFLFSEKVFPGLTAENNILIYVPEIILVFMLLGAYFALLKKKAES